MRHPQRARIPEMRKPPGQAASVFIGDQANEQSTNTAEFNVLQDVPPRILAAHWFRRVELEAVQ